MQSIIHFVTKKHFTAATILAIMLIYGCGTTQQTRESGIQVSRTSTKSLQTEIQSDTYVIRQNDQIQLSVWGYPEFNTTSQVKESGTITMALIGDVVAAGLTKEQFTQQVRQKLAEYIQGEIKLSLSVVTSVSQKVSVLGYVGKQGNYPITSEVTLMETLSAAEGTTAESDLQRIKIIHFGDNKNPLVVNLDWYIENGNLDAVPMVRPGDTVFVPKKENVIRELSDFLRDAFLLFGFFRIFN